VSVHQSGKTITVTRGMLAKGRIALGVVATKGEPIHLQVKALAPISVAFSAIEGQRLDVPGLKRDFPMDTNTIEQLRSLGYIN
jgi:hypothetical protein